MHTNTTAAAQAPITYFALSTLAFFALLVTLSATTVRAADTGGSSMRGMPPAQQPIVWRVTQTSATVSLPRSIAASLSREERKSVYVEYVDAQKVCPAIYPIPAECAPKRTLVTFPGDRGPGQRVLPYATLKDLTPATLYSVTIVKDNTIRCITTPCPENGRQLGSTTFTTKKKGASATGTTTFTGTITAVSNACFADGECSITLTDTKTGESKKVITTIGWSREVVGRVRGAFEVLADDAMVGHTATVFAKEVGKDYTLYGSAKYYIDIKK